MCRALQASYIKSGGSDPKLLAQLAAAEKKALSVMAEEQCNPYPAGIFILLPFYSLPAAF